MEAGSSSGATPAERKRPGAPDTEGGVVVSMGVAIEIRPESEAAGVAEAAGTRVRWRRKDVTTSNSARTIGRKTIWAMRSPGRMVKGRAPRFQQDTSISPW